MPATITPADDLHPIPGKTTSLLAMLRVYAMEFVLLTRTIDDIARTVEKCRRGLKTAEPKERESLRAQLPSLVVPLLDSARKACERLDLVYAGLNIQRIQEAYGGGAGSIKLLRVSLEAMARIIEDELKSRVFLYIRTDRARFFDEEPASLGPKVQDTFPEVSGDVIGASRCLGVGLPAGAVYYLMRVMESGIRRLARRLKVKPNKVRRKTWDTILKEINAAIVAMAALPSLSARRRAFYDQCAGALAHLNAVRIAWRNKAMHAEGVYTQEEAEAIYANVKTFMNFLADKIF